jgi:2-oxoglutarate ferredoxin oxidoreductase subunit gamma
MAMRKDVFMAGTGGQGVLLIGQLLTQAASEDGLQVSYFPVYSPEVRGGSTTCTVVISDGVVGSPVCGYPATMLLMDQYSVDANIARLKPQGLVVINSSLARKLDREDVRVVAIPATVKAAEIGNERIANMVMLGAYVGVTQAVSAAALEQALKVVLPERHHKYLPLNVEALRAGAELAAEATG